MSTTERVDLESRRRRRCNPSELLGRVCHLSGLIFQIAVQYTSVDRELYTAVGMKGVGVKVGRVVSMLSAKVKYVIVSASEVTGLGCSLNITVSRSFKRSTRLCGSSMAFMYVCGQCITHIPRCCSPPSSVLLLSFVCS